MLRRLWLFIFYVPFCAWAQTDDTLTWLDNRFRVDPAIEQISFIVTREQSSQSVVLVAPDGRKYYVDRHPKTMSWHSDNGIDIISINHPMAGPWQALGKIAANNGIRIISNIQLRAETLPAQLYQTETLKFSARLTHNGQPLLLHDFLERVQLRVIFYPLLSESSDVTVDESTAIEVGQFADNGQDYDEVAGDGVFTVALAINVEPGKYRIKIASVNGVFERAVEQTVLVYPTPISISFTQSHQLLVPDMVAIDTQPDQIIAGSLAAYIVVHQPQTQQKIIQRSAIPQQSQLALTWLNSTNVGKAWWRGWVYATDTLTQRELVFQLPQQNYMVTAAVTSDLASSFVQQRLAQQQVAAWKALKLQRQQRLFWIVIANISVVITSIIFLLLWRRWRASKHDLMVYKPQK